jgi:hypothetical protein
MEISIRLNDLSITLDESLKKELEEKVKIAIGNIKVEDIVKAINSEILKYDFESLIEDTLDSLDISSINAPIEKAMKKSITDKLK